jgi:hypothetical protein
MTLRAGSDYSLSYKNNVNPGTATVVVKGEGNFKGKISTTFKVGKPANPMTVKVASMSVAYNELYTAGKTFSPLTVSNAVGDVTYAVVSKNAALSFNTKTGKLTVLKGTYPGTYTMKVKVTAAGSEKYAAASKTVELTVTVSGTIKQNETESNDKLADANQMIIGANMHGEFRQNDSDWFFVEVKNPGYYKLELTMDEYVEQGGNINAYLYENANTLSSAKTYVAVYENEEKKSATSPSLYLPKGYSYINVGGYVSWTGKFKYHIRLIKE